MIQIIIQGRGRMYAVRRYEDRPSGLIFPGADFLAGLAGHADRPRGRKPKASRGKPMDPRVKDMTGKRCGRLVVIGHAGSIRGTKGHNSTAAWPL